MPNTAINAALAAAETSAAASLPAVTVNATAVATPMPGVGRRITTDDRVGGSLNVDQFIKFTAGGVIQVGASVTDTVQKIRVFLNLSEVVPGFGISYEDAGGTLHYIRTEDNETTDNGGSWAEEVGKARRIMPSIRPYNAWQIPFILKDDVAGPAKKGDRLGYTTVWSSFIAFQPVFDNAEKTFGKGAFIELELSCTIKKNAKNKVYGCPTFTLIGEVSQED